MYFLCDKDIKSLKVKDQQSVLYQMRSEMR